jgi:regulator of protease activity HflC (stomatin/prohibitin superfamily)
MFGIGYLREGSGLSFLYYKPTSTVVMVPAASADVPFVFADVTRDFQEVTVQGQITYRVIEPKKLARLLDYSVEPSGKYKSDDPEKLEERLVNAAQVIARNVIGKLTLRETLGASEQLVEALAAGLRAHELIAMLGIEPLGVTILQIRPTPEMARAREAEARERLQREADESIYARRNAAVEQERIIKESELSTELAVEAKKREIRERKMAADIAVEDQRSELVSRKVQNDKQDADGRA